LARVKWWWIFAFGGVGAVLRYGLATFVQTRAGETFPWGTLSVNVAGCFAIGLLATAFEERSVVSPELRLAVLVGLLGGFTTFSTFGLETWRLLEDAELGRALANVSASIMVCVLAVVSGVRLARWLA
jgi:CrcB protein